MVAGVLSLPGVIGAPCGFASATSVPGPHGSTVTPILQSLLRQNPSCSLRCMTEQLLGSVTLQSTVLHNPTDTMSGHRMPLTGAKAVNYYPFPLFTADFPDDKEYPLLDK